MQLVEDIAAKFFSAWTTRLLKRIKPWWSRSRAKSDTALMAAAIGNTKEVECLLKEGADVDTRSQNGQTALINASEYGHAGIAKILIDAPASAVEREKRVNAHDKDGDTPLICASRYGHKETIKLLLNAKARASAHNKLALTPLMLAVTYRHEEVVKLLLAAGAEINMQDKDGMTALMRSVLQRDTSIIRLLLDQNALIGTCSSGGKTAQDYAWAGGDKDSIHILDTEYVSDDSRERIGQEDMEQIADDHRDDY